MIQQGISASRPARPEYVWPMYFATRALDAPRLKLNAGDPFPLQDKFSIRGLGRSFGVPEADRLPFSDLPYVTTLNVHSEEMARAIRDQGLDLKRARKLVERGQVDG